MLFLRAVICAWLLLIDGFTYGLHSNRLGEVEGARRFRVYPRDENELHYLQTTMTSDVADFWTLPRQIGDSVDFTVSEWMYPVMKNMLNKMDISFQVVDEDLGRSIKKHIEEVNIIKKNEMDWITFHPYNEIVDWMDKMASEFESIVSVRTFGKSFEGKDLKILKISSGTETKPAIWVNGGIHGREWISPAVSTFLINEIVRNWEVNSKLLQTFDFYFVPLVNPDGYDYSWKEVRVWSKTRSDAKLTSQCVGVDPNRNWNISWNENEKNTNPCSDSYPGSKSFSEPETSSLRKEILNMNQNVLLLLNLQAYGQKWFSSCSYAGSFKEDCKAMDILGKKIVSASNGTQYEYIHEGALTFKYSMSGTLVEWADVVARIPYAYVVELPDSGSSGFLLGPSKIRKVGEEMMAAIKVISKFLRKKSLNLTKAFPKEEL